MGRSFRILRFGLGLIRMNKSLEHFLQNFEKIVLLSEEVAIFDTLDQQSNDDHRFGRINNPNEVFELSIFKIAVYTSNSKSKRQLFIAQLRDGIRKFF